MVLVEEQTNKLMKEKSSETGPYIHGYSFIACVTLQCKVGMIILSVNVAKSNVYPHVK
jgi:hypothetical protein